MPSLTSRITSPRIDVFNPRRLSDQQIDAIATGREDLLNELITIIKENTAGGTIQHMAFVAPRGYGKSFLLRQLRRKVEQLTEEGYPVAFAHLPEETPNITSVARLIDEIRRFTKGDLTGGIGHFRDEAHNALDEALEGLNAVLDDRFGQGKGLVVAAIENFDELLAKWIRKAAQAAKRRDPAKPTVEKLPKGVKSEDATVELALRGVLAMPGNRLMLAISATRNIRNDHPDHPLFQWVLERRLDPWNEREVLEYALRRRRLARGEDAALSDNEQRQLKALAQFTSGAPRMIAVLVDHLLEQDLEHATLNLAALVDELTPYYKHRFEDLSDECQEVFDALLRGGEPASQTEIAKRFAEQNLGQNTISESFKKLLEERLVTGDKERGGNKRGTLYRATDRLMAYWYKQRQIIGHDPAKSGVSHFEEAVELLLAWFTRDELRNEAHQFARAGRRDEAATLMRISREGLDTGVQWNPKVVRKHLTFGLILHLELLLRVLEPADQPASRAILQALQSGVSIELIDRLEQKSRSETGRRKVFFLCALAVAHALQNRSMDLRNDHAVAILIEALQVAETDMDADAIVIAQSFSIVVQANAFGDIHAVIREAKRIEYDYLSTPEARLIVNYAKSWLNWYDEDYASSLHKATEMHALAQELDLPAWSGRALQRTAYALERLGQNENALAQAQQAVEVLRLCQDTKREAEMLGMVSWLCIKLGRYQESLGTAGRLAQYAITEKDFSTASSALTRQSDCLNQLQRYEEAMVVAQKAIDLARMAYDFEKEAWALYNVGSAIDYLNRRDEAVDMLRQSLELNTGDKIRYRTLGLLGYCLGMIGKHKESIDVLAEAATLANQQGYTESLPNTLKNLLIYSNRMPHDADFTVSGPKILMAFSELAKVDAAEAVNFVAVAWRAAAALGQQEAFRTVLQDIGLKMVVEPDQAKQFARALVQLAEASDRAQGYATIVTVLSALAKVENATTTEGYRDLIRALTVRLDDPGLLRDLADFLEEQDSQAHAASIAALRGHSLSLESGGDATAMERVDPDLGRLFRSMKEIGYLPTHWPHAKDPDLAVRPCVVAPFDVTHFAGLPLASASEEVIARFDKSAPTLGIANLEAFDSTELRTAALPFLPCAQLLLLPHRSSGVAVPFVLHHDEMVLAARQHEWLYGLMTRHAPFDWLKEDTANNEVLFTYVRFFSAVIVSSAGGFRFISQSKDIPWLPDASEADKEKIGAQVEPMRRLKNTGGFAIVQATVLFKNDLLRTSVRVQPDGTMEPTDEGLLAENLPIVFGREVELVVTG